MSKFMSKKALVTGATGFVGSNLVRRLIAENYEVHILVRQDSNQWRLSDISGQLQEHLVDLSEVEKLRQVVKEIKPQAIFHLAAFSIYSAYTKEENEKGIIDTNFLGLVNLLNACNEIDYKVFINTGSSSEYGLKKAPMKETDLCQPVNVYGIAKLAATLYSSYIAKIQNKPVVTLRLFSPFGPYDDGKRLIPHVVKHALNKNDVEVNNSEVVRDYIYIDDLVDLYLQVANFSNIEGIKGEIFNVGSGQEVRIGKVVEEITKLTDSKIQVKWKNQKRDWESEVWQADIAKTSQTFNWQPKHSLTQGLEKTISWFKNNLGYYND